METKEVKKISDDFTDQESSSLQNYISNGCPGLVRITEDKAFNWFKLYMSGKTYKEIADMTGDRYDLILYVSFKTKWHEKRMEYYADLNRNIYAKMRKAKMDSANTVCNALTALGKYYDEKFNKYIMTNDDTIMEMLDTKMLGQYYKSLEMLDKLMGVDENNTPNTPMVNINIKSDSKVEQKDNNTIDITTNSSQTKTDDAAADLLKALANYKRSKN